MSGVSSARGAAVEAGALRGLVLAWVLLLLGPAAAWSRSLEPMAGFGVFALGLLLAVGLGLGGGLIVWLLGGKPRRLLLLGGAALVLGLGAALPGVGAPRINDVSTDGIDPPTLSDAMALDGLGLPMDYDPSFAAITAAHDPDLGSIELASSPTQVLEDARRCLEQRGARAVQARDERVQGTFESALFHFRDDAVVRVRPAPGGATVDLRSKSRDGQGDLGANAARIRQLQACLKAAHPGL